MGVFGEKHTSLTREQKRQLIHQADTHKLRPTEVCDWVLQTWGLRIARVTVYSILHKQRASLMAGHKDLYQSMQKSLSSSSSSTSASTKSPADQPSSDAQMKRCRKNSQGRITKRSPSASPRTNHRRNSSVSSSSGYQSCSSSPAPTDLTFASTSDSNGSSSHGLSHLALPPSSPCPSCIDASRCSHATPAGSAGSAQPNSSAGGTLGSLGSRTPGSTTTPNTLSSSRSASGAKWEGQLKRVREPASVELDRAMVRFLKSDQAVDANGRRLNDAELQSHALRLAKSIPSAARMRCSFGWLRHFKRRLGVQWAADRLGRYRWIIEMDHEDDNDDRGDGEPSTDAASPPPPPTSEGCSSPSSSTQSSPTPSPVPEGSSPSLFPTAFDDGSLTHVDNSLCAANQTNNNNNNNNAASPSRKRKSGSTAKANQSSSVAHTPSTVTGSWPMLTHLKQESIDHDHHHHHQHAALNQVLYHSNYPTQPLGTSATTVTPAGLHEASQPHEPHASSAGYHNGQQLFASTGSPLTPLDTLPPLVIPNNAHHGSPDISTLGADQLSSTATIKHESIATQVASSSSASSAPTSSSSTSTSTSTTSFGMSVDGGMRKVPTKEEALDMLQSLLLYYEQEHHYTGEQQTLLLPRWIHQQRQIMQQASSDDSRLSWLRAAPPSSLFHPIDFTVALGGGGAGSVTSASTTASSTTAPATSCPSSPLNFLGLPSPAPSVSSGHHQHHSSPSPFQLQQPPHMPMGMHPLAMPLHHQVAPGPGLHTIAPLSPLSPGPHGGPTTPSEAAAAAAAAAAATTASFLSAAASAGLLTMATTATTTASSPSSTLASTAATTTSPLMGGGGSHVSSSTTAVGSAGTNTVATTMTGSPSSSSSSSSSSTSSTSPPSSIPSLASPMEQQMYYLHQQRVAETHQLARMMYSTQ
ncbi:hypothetical protein BGW42_008261 [Actinomortierella wolfii]|nr:hypothetical protein BGW42_008261 [Actinomortierella wolfii]